MEKTPKITKKVHLLIFFIIGVFLFAYFLYKFGAQSVLLIVQNFNLYYLSIFFLITLIGFVPLVWRWQVILKAYKIKGKFWTLLRNTMSGYAVSYTTPASRMGGEPVRIYMLKKELNVNYKTGSATVLIDRYMELLGTASYSIIALTVLILSPTMPLAFKVTFGIMNLIAIPIILLILYKYIKKEGILVNIYDFLRLHKIKKWEKFRSELNKVDILMSNFFAHHKKEFFLSYFFYIISGLLWLIEFKYLLLSFGVETSITEVILVSTVIGLVNFAPVPAQLGFLEAGQTSLFQALRGDSSIGFALTLLLRARYLILVAIGYLFIAHFSLKEYLKR
jgi:glycosyltransferase 2 family protein